jgi:hypothetical protein
MSARLAALHQFKLAIIGKDRRALAKSILLWQAIDQRPLQQSVDRVVAAVSAAATVSAASPRTPAAEEMTLWCPSALTQAIQNQPARRLGPLGGHQLLVEVGEGQCLRANGLFRVILATMATFSVFIK